MSTISTTSQLSNYVSCLGNNDAVIMGTNYDLDVSFNTANTAVSLLSAQIVISKVFPMTAVATGNGFTISGWFLPYGKTQKSNALLIEMDSSVNPTAVYLTGGSSYSLNAVYNGVVVTTNSDISAGMVLPQTWNYFCYTVECSGNTVGTAQAIQSLYLNGSSIPVVNTTALYVSSPFTVTYMGKGIVYTNQFQGKLAEMRSFQRVLNPVENRVLSACNNVGSAGALTIVPSVVIYDISSTGIYVAPYTMTNTIMFSSASMFSYLTISRTPAFLYAPTTVTVSLSTLQRVNGNFVWNDVSVNAITAYTYTITPFVSGNGASPTTTLITSGIAHGPPTTLVLSGTYNYPNVTLSWTGGLGDNMTLTYTLTSGTANTTTGNLTYNVAGGTANMPITGTGPWTYQVTATNSKGTVNASTTLYPPIAILHWKFEPGELYAANTFADPQVSGTWYQITNYGSGFSGQVGVPITLEYNSGAIITSSPSPAFGTGCYDTQSQGGGNKAFCINTLSPPGYSTGGGYTITGWYNMNGFGNVVTWTNNAAGYANNVYFMNLRIASSSIVCNFGATNQTANTNYLQNTGFNTTITAGAWYYVAVVVNYVSTTQTNFQLYYSKQGDGVPTSVSYTSSNITFQPWNWCGGNFGLSQNQDGTRFCCDDLRYYNAPLSLSRIQTIYSGAA